MGADVAMTVQDYVAIVALSGLAVLAVWTAASMFGLIRAVIR